MEQQNYSCVICVNAAPAKAFEAIGNVAKWWTENFEGASQNAGDVFTVRFGETVVTFEVTEAVPNNKAVWLVTGCYLPWLDHKTEWTGTRVVFGISAENGRTKIKMTHLGLVPEAECFNTCIKGWDFYIKQSLFNLLTENKGQPDKIKSATAAGN